MIRFVAAQLATLLALLLSTSAPAAIVPVTLNVTADDASTYYEYYSDGFARISLRDASPNEFRQRFHNIPNPAVFYGAIDVFPNDNAMNFGQLFYDDSTLVSGTGTAAVTGVNFAVRNDPLNPSYLNYNRFDLATVVHSSSGSVSLINGAVTSINLTIDLEMQGIYLSSTTPGTWPGTFTISGSQFNLAIDGSPSIQTVFDTEPGPFHVEWDFFGTVLAVEEVPEPGSLALLGAAAPLMLGSVLVWRRRRRHD